MQRPCGGRGVGVLQFQGSKDFLQFQINKCSVTETQWVSKREAQT